MTGFLTRMNGELRVQVQVQPRSSKTGWGEVVEYAGHHWIRLKIASPPVDGAANRETTKLLAKQLKTAKSNIKLILGEKSRYKVFLVSSFDEEKLQLFATANDCSIA